MPPPSPPQSSRVPRPVLGGRPASLEGRSGLGGLPAVLRLAGTSRGSVTGPRALGLGTVFKCGVIF